CSPSARCSNTCQTMIRVPLKVGFPWQASGVSDDILSKFDAVRLTARSHSSHHGPGEPLLQVSPDFHLVPEREQNVRRRSIHRSFSSEAHTISSSFRAKTWRLAKAGGA